MPNKGFISLDPCYDDPCHNGAACERYEEGYKGEHEYWCSCPDGWGGHHCDQHIFIPQPYGHGYGIGNTISRFRSFENGRDWINCLTLMCLKQLQNMQIDESKFCNVYTTSIYALWETKLSVFLW